MKKIRIFLLVIALVFTTFMSFGCVKKNEIKEETNQKVEEQTVAKVLANQFIEEIKNEKDIEKVANKISNNIILENISLETVAIQNGDYVSGFQTEIKDFKKAVAIRPIIGSIPFVAYIFEVEDSKNFAEILKTNADLRWNICTEADNMEISIFEQYVFFVMAPENFE